MSKLSEQKIGTRPFFYPMHRQPVFNKLGLFINETHNISEKLYNQGFYLPSGLNLTKEKIEYVCEKLYSIIPS